MTSELKNDRAAWIRGPSAECSVNPVPLPRPWRLVLIGAPGVGKGTQAELQSERLGACHLSTGDIFRACASCDSCCPSPAMEVALAHMRRGKLVPDSTVWELVRERVGCVRCGRGFIFDGFPRTVAQANALEGLLKSEGLALDAVLDYRLPLDQIVSRLSGRRTCSKCKAIFHITTRPPKAEGICDHCGADLIQRDDDRPEAIKVRMSAYERDTAPLTEFYKTRDLLLTIPAEGSPEDIFARTIAAMQPA